MRLAQKQLTLNALPLLTFAWKWQKVIKIWLLSFNKHYELNKYKATIDIQLVYLHKERMFCQMHESAYTLLSVHISH